jgi:serine/threonine protein kinase
MYLEPGTTLSDYTIVRKLGRGATGVVYQATDQQGRAVALKVMIAELDADGGDARERFLREATALIPLRHRNLVTTFAAGVHDDSPYVAMELLAGTTLRDRLRMAERLSTAASLDIVIQLCDGLQFAHERGIVHRDVKPANVWLSPNGGVKLLDFGLAHIAGSNLTQVGDVLGSAGYMAPEQLAGTSVDARADVFAAGVILFELLTGRPPFQGDNIAGIMEAVFNQPVPDVSILVPGLAPDVGHALRTALEKNPADRYGNAADFASDLRLARYLVSSHPTAHAPSVPAPPQAAAIDEQPSEPATILVPPRTPSANRAPAGGGTLLPGIPTGPVRAVTADAPPPMPKRLRAGATQLMALVRAWTSKAGRWTTTTASVVRKLPRSRAIPAAAAATLILVATLVGATTWRGSRAESAPARDTTPGGAATQGGGSNTRPQPPTTATIAAKPQITKSDVDRDLAVRGAGGKTSPAAPKEQLPGQPPSSRPSAIPVAVRVTGGYPFEVSGCGRSLPSATEHEFEAQSPCTLRLRAPQYFMNMEWPINASSGQVELVAPQLARVELRSRYEKCTIVVAGHAVGAPPVDIEIASGTYRVDVQCGDRSYVIRELTIPPGRSTRRLDEFLP